MASAQMLERLGFNGALSSAIGAELDAQVGDVAGMMQNLADMYTKGLTGGIDRLFGSGMAPSCHCGRPGEALARTLDNNGMGFNPMGGFSREAPFGEGKMGKSIEKAIRKNPMFKAQMERLLGGSIIPDGCKDGKLTVFRPQANTVGELLNRAMGPNMLKGIAGALAGLPLPLMGSPLSQAMGRLAANMGAFAQQGVGGAQGSIGASGAEGVKPGSWASTLSPEDKTFADGMGISLAGASFEDVLFILLMKYAKKKEDDIMNKVKELDKSMQEGKDGGGKGGKGGKGGLLGGIGGMVGGLVGGPVGSMIGKGVGGMLGGGGASGAGGGGGGGGGGGMEGANLGEKMDPSKMSDTMKQQMLQKLMGDLQKLYEMLSNMIKSMHDMQMTPTRNLRG